MKSSELIEFLSKHPDCEVILSKDSEGNSYSPLEDPCVMYVEKPYEGGDLGPHDIVEEGDLTAEVDEDPLDYFKPVVVLYPF